VSFLAPGLPEHGIGLATVKDAARRLRRWPAAILDRRCARSHEHMQAGTKKRRFQPNQETTRKQWPKVFAELDARN